MPAAVTYLDAPRLRRCLLAGLQKLIAEREHLNRINVFPVPDGDTGNNLAQTAVYAQMALTDYSGDAIGPMLEALAGGSLDGAQGNSGVMLAQFFQGLASSLHDANRVDTHAMAEALAIAAVQTRNALTHPREGTMISAIDAAAAAARASQKRGDFSDFLHSILEATRAAVKATTSQLEELRRANVVDAGALGFCFIVEGCVDFLQHGSLRQIPLLPVSAALPFSTHEHSTEDPAFRYCTECMVVGANLSPARIRQELVALGDSMVIAGSDTRLRIHIHTDEPESIFDLVGQFGQISHTKADDMLVQARSLRRSDREVAVVTDSGADIPDALMRELDIHMVSLRVQFGTESHLDKSGMSPSEFHAELQHNPNRPGTSQPTPGDLRRMFEFLGAHFGEILSISLSAALSGTHQGTVAAAARVSGSERIHVIDSRSVSVGQGLAVVHAARLAAQGLRGAELQQAVAQECARIRCFALVPDLSSAVRSGRLPGWVQNAAEWLRLNPILTGARNGKVSVCGFLPGNQRLVERFARRVARKLGREKPLEFAIAHGYSETADATLLEAQIIRRLPNARCAWRTELGTALGVHAGMTALVVAFRETGSDTD